MAVSELRTRTGNQGDKNNSEPSYGLNKTAPSSKLFWAFIAKFKVHNSTMTNYCKSVIDGINIEVSPKYNSYTTLSL